MNFREQVCRHLRYTLGSERSQATLADLSRAFALAARERLIDGLYRTRERVRAAGAKQVYYLSMEFLMGRSLHNNLVNLGLWDDFLQTATEWGLSPEKILDAEQDAALGNGGLGRLAACFLDSLATLGLPGHGYGLNYQYGLFRQEISRGWQREAPDHWAAGYSPWLIRREDEYLLIPVYGRLRDPIDDDVFDPLWLDWKLIVGMPYDMPVVGYGGETVNMLRLYSAGASDEFDIEIFNQGDYIRAIEQKVESERLSMVLYPSDSVASGKELRLLQEYFLVACAIRDITNRFLAQYNDVRLLPDHVAIQLNDTHPALAVAELMRFLVDEKAIAWEEAWRITRAVCAFTNHTLLPEALEKWPLELMQRVLPRHMQIIFDINHHFLQQVAARWPGDTDRLRRMSLIEEEPERQVRMAHLCIVGSHSVNGVAALHSELVRTRLVPDFAAMFPERFNNKTNGVTPRRWLLCANPPLARLITEAIGDGWIRDAEQLRRLEPLAEDPGFLDAFAKIKMEARRMLAGIVRKKALVDIDPAGMYSVQAKRIHEYKRQLLHAMLIIDSYFRVVEDGWRPPQPRAFLVAGKAAPGYFMAKLIIHLIHAVADVVNGDARARDWLQVAFIPDYKVSIAETILPAANLSEQISTAGTEASGTGNMKFALNGALTMATLDGANIEIREQVGADNIYIFGHTAAEIAAHRAAGTYDPGWWVRQHPRLRRVIDAIAGNYFSAREPGVFDPIVDALLRRGDYYFHCGDFPAYAKAEEQAQNDYAATAAWNRRAVLNIARWGRFSSDRTVLEYAREIWGIA